LIAASMMCGCTPSSPMLVGIVRRRSCNVQGATFFVAGLMIDAAGSGERALFHSACLA
jgi:hypothetical protein